MPDCTPVLMPVVKADFCAPDLNFAQIDKIYLGNAGEADFTDWSSLAEWNLRLDNTSVLANAIKTLHVIASKPKPEATKVKYSQGREVLTEKKHTIPVKVDETHDENYLFVKWLEDNVGQQLQLWYQAGKYLYGGPGGISIDLFLDDVIAEDDQVLNTFDGEASWKGNHPDRIANPLA